MFSKGTKMWIYEPTTFEKISKFLKVGELFENGHF
jgi:hypothetical protein